MYFIYIPVVGGGFVCVMVWWVFLCLVVLVFGLGFSFVWLRGATFGFGFVSLYFVLLWSFFGWLFCGLFLFVVFGFFF